MQNTYYSLEIQTYSSDSLNSKFVHLFCAASNRGRYRNKGIRGRRNYGAASGIHGRGEDSSRTDSDHGGGSRSRWGWIKELTKDHLVIEGIEVDRTLAIDLLETLLQFLLHFLFSTTTHIIQGGLLMKHYSLSGPCLLVESLGWNTTHIIHVFFTLLTLGCR